MKVLLTDGNRYLVYICRHHKRQPRVRFLVLRFLRGQVCKELFEMTCIREIQNIQIVLAFIYSGHSCGPYEKVMRLIPRVAHVVETAV